MRMLIRLLQNARLAFYSSHKNLHNFLFIMIYMIICVDLICAACLGYNEAIFYQKIKKVCKKCCACNFLSCMVGVFSVDFVGDALHINIHNSSCLCIIKVYCVQTPKNSEFL